MLGLEKPRQALQSVACPAMINPLRYTVHYMINPNRNAVPLVVTSRDWNINTTQMYIFHTYIMSQYIVLMV